jgi:deferrochelatase/peroxidase EfeB
MAGAVLPVAAAQPASGASAQTVPFRGAHQGGIATPVQSHTYFAAFDLDLTRRDDVARLFQAWTAAAERMTAGRAAVSTDGARAASVAADAAAAYAAPGAAWDPHAGAGDSGEALGLSPARLTLTFGFGPGLFADASGADRYGLAARRPQALVELPKFPGDQLLAERTGGDLSVQACADDPQVAFHAVRQLARIADGAARVRWVQAGFQSGAPAGQTGRNLMGFKDGTINPSGDAALNTSIWAGAEAPPWMQGGSYLVARRIRIALEHWDRMQVAFQEQVIGRQKLSGAPLGAQRESDALDLAAVDRDGNPVIAPNSHAALAAPQTNGGARILRRAYSYNDGVNLTAERWPPWREAMEYDAGLMFLAYQRDPRTGFIPMYARMSRLDMMNQFVTHVGGGLFACPRGAGPGEYIGQALFEA